MNAIDESKQQSDQLPSINEVPTVLQTAVGQMEWSRRYTHELLEATPMDRWYETPSGHMSNVAWQVGHLAVSQYGLLMFRIRGRKTEDLSLIPGRFRKTYGRGGTPPLSQDGQPDPAELLTKLNTVHKLAMAEIANVDPAVLLEPVEMPYAVHACKLGAVLFAPMHESLHAGQIGGLRRGLGLEPIR
ncbi:MAG: DinB family protein [Planctomycetota bacterium]